MTTNPEHDWNNPDPDRVENMAAVLPAWFCSRMATDVWHFGLLLTTGQMLHVETIVDVHQSTTAGVWVDVVLGEPVGVFANSMHARGWPKPTHSPTSRRMCSVNVAQVVCAVELADT